MVDVDDEVPIEARDLRPRELAALEDHDRVSRRVNMARQGDSVHARERPIRRRDRVAIAEPH